MKTCIVGDGTMESHLRSGGEATCLGWTHAESDRTWGRARERGRAGASETEEGVSGRRCVVQTPVTD